MLRVFQIALSPDHSDDDLRRALTRSLDVQPDHILSFEIRRRAIDARKKNDVRLVYTLDVALRDEATLVRRGFRVRATASPDEAYRPATPGHDRMRNCPVVVGAGPAGLFAALTLARSGYRPILLERGKPVGQRCIDVERFWAGGDLDPESNAQFGEGGAGAFSDGKLNTNINDPRCRQVLRELVDAGAPTDILVSHKPHVGTDRLRIVLAGLRRTILGLGGEVRFSHRVTGLRARDGILEGLDIAGLDAVECSVAVLAIGHSARDTFNMLLQAGCVMTQKPFAVGVRIEHAQRMIDQAQYGSFAGHPRLGAADYKLAWHGPGGRSAYTFCMCPGGEVMAAASERFSVVTNGMSNLTRDGTNANAALLVNVAAGDLPSGDPLAGFEFQRAWEQKAFELGGANYHAPVQLAGDFLHDRPTAQLGAVAPTYRPGVTPGRIDDCLPEFVCATIRQALPSLARQLRGFSTPDAVLTGVETRSTCPVRIVREASMECRPAGLYPAGEGAGYAGGIMSAAVDGMRAAEAVIGRYRAP